MIIRLLTRNIGFEGCFLTIVDADVVAIRRRTASSRTSRPGAVAGLTCSDKYRAFGIKSLRLFNSRPLNNSQALKINELAYKG